MPRFALRVACPDQLDEPIALAPQPGSKQAIGEVSGPAESYALHLGMPLVEALARCPSLRLIRANPAGAAEVWDGLLGRLEGIGAAVESERSGEAFFAVQGLCAIHGGEVRGVLAAAREAAQMPVQIAAAPNRFAASLAAERGRRIPRPLAGASDEAIVPARALRTFIAPLPVTALSGARLGVAEGEASELVLALKRLGLKTLGRLAALHPDRVADRFGALGLRALRLASGEDEPLRPRWPREDLVAEIELAQGTAGPQLDRALELLVDRLLADGERQERTILALRLSASFDGGGSWCAEQTMSRPTASARAIGSLLIPKLEALPEPATTLRLRVLAFGPSTCDQLELPLTQRKRPHDRLRMVVGEIRATAGAEALLKVIDVDPNSRVPERRALLAPFPEL